MLYLQKGKFQKITRWIGGKWMTANQATLFGCICIAIVSASFYFGLSCPDANWMLLLVPAFLLLRMMMNTLDGMLAREYHTGTVAGELWNEALDILGDNVCYGILWFVPEFPKTPLVIFLLLTWAAEFFGVLGKSMPGGVRRHETVLGGKPDRAVWMGLLALILFFAPDFLTYTGYYVSGVCVFVFLTSAIRIRKILNVSEGKKYESFTWIGR